MAHRHEGRFTPRTSGLFNTSGDDGNSSTMTAVLRKRIPAALACPTHPRQGI